MFCSPCIGTKGVGGEHNGPVHQRQAVPVHRVADDAAGPGQPLLPASVADYVPRYA